MAPRQRGTRRAGSFALLWGLLLWGAAETGGATAPPCANATPLFTTSTESIKPVGDPDTPDEGGHSSKSTSSGAIVSPVKGSAVIALEPGESFTFWNWLRSFMGFFHQQG